MQKLIIVTGATAAGKSAFLYENLREFSLVVINADSRQVYADLEISSASPNAVEKTLFPHRLYNFLPLDAHYSAGAFVREATAEIEVAHVEGRVPLLCGGTYFYLHALLYGLLPPITVPDKVRAYVENLSGEAAYNELHKRDAVAATNIHSHNEVRVKRALMLCIATETKISAAPKSGGIAERYDILMLIFDGERALLRERIAARVQEMFAAGLVEEIAQVMEKADSRANHGAWRQLPALTGIGIREFFEAREVGAWSPLNPQMGLGAIGAAITKNTAQLVKKQQTWYRNAQPKPINTKTVDLSYEKARIAAFIKEFVR